MNSDPTNEEIFTDEDFADDLEDELTEPYYDDDDSDEDEANVGDIYIGAVEEYDPELAQALDNFTEEDWDDLEQNNPQLYNQLQDLFDQVDEELENES